MAAIENSSYNRAIALTSDISYKGKFNWFNSEKTILDLGGCDNLVNSSFAKHHLRLDIQTDTSLAAQDIQRSVNGDTFHFEFTSFVEIYCNFKGHREKVRFYLMDKLPLPFLIGYPFFVEKGAVFDLNVPTVILNKTPSIPVINLLPATTESIPSIDSFSIFTGNYEPTTINAIFCNVKQDLDMYL